MTIQAPNNKNVFHFWYWLAKRGLVQFLDRWLIVHLLIGYLVQHFLKMPLYDLAWKLIIPFAAILVAIVFAWSGNISTLLQTNEMDDIRRKNNFEIYSDYVFNFQLVALVNLTLIVIWSILGLDPFKGIAVRHSLYVSGRVFMFAFTSIAIRECWTMILRLQLHLIQFALIRDNKQKIKKVKLMKLASKALAFAHKNKKRISTSKK